MLTIRIDREADDMPLYRRGQTAIHYEIHGSGHPLLLLPPGGMNATIDFWEATAFNAVQVFAENFRVIAIDQRNAGQSTGPIGEGNPWDDFLEDHLGLLNHLGIARCHVLGCCIGASFALNLARVAPGRITALVLEQPTGRSEENDHLLGNIWREWVDTMLARSPEPGRDRLEDYAARMWGGDFVMSVTREDVAACKVPMLVLPGIDAFHPGAIGREIIALAPDARGFEPWKEPADLVPAAVAAIRDFLKSHEA